MYAMAVYTTEAALEAIFGEDFDSGDESEIEDDPLFPLPRSSDEESDSGGEDLQPSDPSSSSSDEQNRSRSPPRGRGRSRGRGRGKGRGEAEGGVIWKRQPRRWHTDG